MQGLERLLTEDPESLTTTMLLFVVQRGDVTSFELSHKDRVYRRAVEQAVESGVTVECIQVAWDGAGQRATFQGTLPIRWDV